MNDLISQIERKTISFSAYESYKFFKDLALVYMGNHGYDLAFQYADKSKREREQMAIDAMELPAKQEEQRDWIPVTERLPEVNQTVFVLVDKEPFTGYLDINKKWHVLSTLYCSVDKRKITHYMIIPALPEQEGR